MSNCLLSLSNRKVLLTGGSSGIGNSIACALLDAGAEVSVLSRRPPEEWENNNIESLLRTHKILWIPADLRDVHGTLRNLRNWQADNNGELDVLIHSAVTYGSNSRRPLLKISLEEWDEVFAVNTRPTFFLTKEFLPLLEKKPAGLIINVSSEVVVNFGPGRIDYSASKAASYNLFASLAEELRQSNVRVVNLFPETQVDTPGIRKRRPPNFNYSSFASPDCFRTPILKIVEQMGEGMNGCCFIVKPDGNFVSLTEVSLPSQTH
jgi:cyclitol oxidoreductase